jgi:hypothetical protein
VLNGFQYRTTTNGESIGLGTIRANTVDGLNIVSGGFEIGAPGFYAQVNNSITTVNAAGFAVPLKVSVLPAVYLIQPSYTPTKKNTSGIVLQTAPWTQETATISATDQSAIAAASATSVWNTPESSITTANTVGVSVKSIKNNTGLIPALL